MALSLSSASRLLQNWDSLPQLLALLPLSPGSQSPLSALMVEAIRLDNRHHAKAAVAALLRQCPDWSSARDPKTGDTVLMAALRRGHLDIAEALLSFGADPKARTPKKQNALDAAISYSDNPRLQEAVVQFVLDACAFTRSQKSFALVEAAEQSNLGATRALLKAGADGSVSVESFGTAQGNVLVVACSVPEEPDSHQLAIVEALLATPSIRATLNKGWDNETYGTPLHNAAYMSHEDLVAKLLAAGAQVNPPAEWENARTPLMATAFSGVSPEIMAQLIGAGADVNAVDGQGRTAFHHLAEAEDGLDAPDEFAVHARCATVLLKAGANPTIRDSNGDTPADLAREVGRPALAEFLEAAVGLEERASPEAGPSRRHKQTA